jgi:hypothetical protein
MFTLKWTFCAREDFDRLSIAAESRRGSAKSSKQEGLFKQVSKTTRLLSSNPRHPGLQTHDFLSLANPFDPAGKVFEAYGQNRTPGAYRVFWCYGPGRNNITIVAITPHP